WSDGRDKAADHRSQTRDEHAPQAGHHGDADEDEESAANQVDDTDVALQPGDGTRHPAETEPDKKERAAQAEAVHCAEHSAATGRTALEAQREHRRERRADAGRPAEAEDDAEERRTSETSGDLPPRLDRALHRPEAADEDEPHDDDDDARDARDDVH